MSRLRLPRWLYPGMHLKRWLLLVFAGIVILGLGGAIFLLNIYRAGELDEVPFFYVITFGFKYGIPLDADLVFDVRFLTNPYWIPDLKPLSGLTDPVRDFVLAQPAAGRFLELVQELLELTTPAYRSEGKSRLAVALGCTGGYHRSIALAEELARRLRETGEGAVTVFHRELDR